MTAAMDLIASDASRCQAALQQAMEFMEPIAPEQWRVRARDAALPPLVARLANGFLVLSGEFAPGRCSSRWDLLTANAGLASGVKFSSDSTEVVSLQAEIPIQQEGNLPLRLAQTCRALSAAWNPGSAGIPAGEIAADLDNAPATMPALPGDRITDGSPAPPDLASLLEDIGWRCSSRRADRCAVSLDTLRGPRTALITAQRGSISVSTELASWDSLSNPCREAMGLLLLNANARLKLARAVIVQEEEGGGAAQLQVLFEGTVSPAEMRCALEALSVGADLCAPAAEILQNETAAELFLAMRGGPRDSEVNQQTSERTSQI